MDEKFILTALRPLKIKIYFYKAAKIFLSAFTISGFISLLLVIVSRFMVIPFVRHKMLVILGISFFAAVLTSLFFMPSKKQVIMTADSLGLEERVITAWYLLDDDSEIAELQRQDTKRALENVNPASAYKIKIDRKLYITPVCIIAAAFLLTFVPGKTFNETRVREALTERMNEAKKAIEDEIEEQKQKNPSISDEQMKQLEEAIEKLDEEFSKAKSEEDALKALTQMENQLEKLKKQEPLKDLNTLENLLGNMPLTKDLAEALKDKDEKALKEAIDRLKQELENEEIVKELSEILGQAAMNMDDDSMLAESLQNLVSEAESQNINGSELIESLLELIRQAEKNALGQEGFENTLDNIGGILKDARKAISAVDSRIASGNTTGTQGQAGDGNANGSRNGGISGNGGSNPDAGVKGDKSGSEGRNPAENRERNNAGSGNGNRNKNQGGSGDGSGDGESGAGAGTGLSSSDAGYSAAGQQASGNKTEPGKVEEYKMIYVPERLGGDGNEITVSGRKLDSGSSTYTDSFGPVKNGQMIPYREVLGRYREKAVQTMDRLDIPAGMKELVKSYFSSLE